MSSKRCDVFLSQSNDRDELILWTCEIMWRRKQTALFRARLYCRVLRLLIGEDMALKQVTITYPDGTKRIVESGDEDAWKQLSKKDREWITYLVQTGTECNDRSLNVDGTNYKPKYTTKRKRRK